MTITGVHVCATNSNNIFSTDKNKAIDFLGENRLDNWDCLWQIVATTLMVLLSQVCKLVPMVLFCFLLGAGSSPTPGAPVIIIPPHNTSVVAGSNEAILECVASGR